MDRLCISLLRSGDLARGSIKRSPWSIAQFTYSFNKQLEYQIKSRLALKSVWSQKERGAQGHGREVRTLMFRMYVLGKYNFSFFSLMSFVEDVEERTTNDSNEIEEVKLLHLPHSVKASPWIPPRRNKRSNIVSLSWWQSFGRAIAIFKNKDIPIVLKRQVYDQCILSTVIYGCETWNLTKQQTLKLKLCREPMKESC